MDKESKDVDDLNVEIIDVVGDLDRVNCPILEIDSLSLTMVALVLASTNWDISPVLRATGPAFVGPSRDKQRISVLTVPTLRSEPSDTIPLC